jgi:tRNA1Val (adenine37-N6)-methyltransferase
MSPSLEPYMTYAPFHFKKFSVFQEDVAHPVGTDGVLLGAWADVSGAHSVLDIGTGTGLVALMLAQRCVPGSLITAVEVHPESAACARRNVLESPWQACLEVVELPVQQFALQTALQFDLIVSNPPFFSDLTVSPNAARSLARHTATLSTGDLLDAVLRLLKPAGRFCAVLPDKEGVRMCEMAAPLGLFCTHLVEVRSHAGKPVVRRLLQLERDPRRFRRERLDIYDRTGGYSEAYRQLTKDFYTAAVSIVGVLKT